jgi:putative ABC transport system ATP-binding protein
MPTAQLPILHVPAAGVVNVTRRYGEGAGAVDALCGVTLEIERGVLTALTGPAGSGLSTLVQIMAGLDRPTTGTVLLDGVDVTWLPARDLTRLRRARVGLVSPVVQLVPMLTVEENVQLPLALAGHKPARHRLRELLATTGLEEYRTHRPEQLSAGCRQRVAVARALASRPAVLFADVPRAADPAADELAGLLRSVVDETGQTVVMATRDAGAAAIADRVVRLAGGRIVA